MFNSDERISWTMQTTFFSFGINVGLMEDYVIKSSLFAALRIVRLFLTKHILLHWTEVTVCECSLCLSIKYEWRQLILWRHLKRNRWHGKCKFCLKCCLCFTSRLRRVKPWMNETDCFLFSHNAPKSLNFLLACLKISKCVRI